MPFSLIHQFNIRSTEVTAVNDDADVFVAILSQLLDHLLELRHVWDGARIGLILKAEKYTLTHFPAFKG